MSGLGWDLHLFPSEDNGRVNPDLRNVTVHHSLYVGRQKHDKSVKLRGIPVFIPRLSKYLAYAGIWGLKHRWTDYRVTQLERLIKKLQPDVIHSMEIQAAGYLVSKVRKRQRGQFPPWIVTNWGSDIYLFGRLASHVSKIKEVLSGCDYYTCECHRDVQLAKQMGLKGEVLNVLPCAGGFDLTRSAQLRQPGSTSARRLILLKGHLGFAGRALVGLHAIALCAKELKGYRIGVYSASEDVRIAAELVSQSTGIPIEILPLCSHDDMLRLFGQARIYLGLSISDAISTSLLEAMVMGAFPIQSCTSCADEWIIDGQSGFIVPPEDPEPIAMAIRRAASDDALVNQASEYNAQIARDRLDETIIRPQVIAMYEKVARLKKRRTLYNQK